MYPKQLLAITVAVPMLLSACNGRNPESPASSPQTAPATTAAPVETSVVEQWLGQWVGPEGTLLLLTRNSEGYEIKIQSLDGPNTYAGKAVSDHLEFQRNGVLESIHAGTGADTGMKWLAEKKHCLVIRQSEGFCRD